MAAAQISKALINSPGLEARLDMLKIDRTEFNPEKFLQLKISNGGYNKIQEIELPSKIGRCPNNDNNTSQLALESPYVSREHIIIEPDIAVFRNKRVIFA